MCFYFILVALRVLLYIYCVSTKLAKCAVLTGMFGLMPLLFAMTVVGTPYYMAPESCQSEPYTSKSDIWALGVILYELCTLRQPFQADNLLGLVFKIVQDNPDPIPSSYSPQL